MRNKMSGQYTRWNMLGNEQFFTERYEEAVASLNKALAIHPNNTMAWDVRGLALSNLNRHAEAVDSYDEALNIDPDDAMVWTNRGIALIELGQYKEAVESFDFNPGYPLAKEKRDIALQKRDTKSQDENSD
jgi:Tfp pilus assembly protein PilF